jgi:hypothetical protein
MGSPRLFPVVAGSVAASILIASSSFGQLTLQASFSLPTVSKPVGAAAADFTGDGYTDVAVTSTDTDEVRIMVGNGFGLLVPGPIVNTGSQTNPGDLRAIDIDADGDLDLAVCLRNSGQVAIYENDGTGIFGLVGTYATGDDCMGPDVGDADHDGDMDLVIANRGDDSFTVLINTNGGFTATTAATSPDPRGAAFGDFDDDGDLDVAVTSNDDRTVRLFRNEGPNFASMLTLNGPASVRPRAIRAADLNSDGAADIVVASDGRTNSFATVFLRSGTGFAAPVNYGSNGAAGGYLSIDDFECDGDLDIALVNEGSANVALFANGGAGTFAAPMLIPTGMTPAAITTADLDGDADTDIALSNTDADTLTVVLLGCGHGGGGGGPVCGNGICEPGENPECVDCQGGGGGPGGPAGHFAFDHASIDATVPFGAIAVDVDLDGDNDIVWASDMPETLKILVNDGSGQFSSGASYPLPYYSIPQEVVSGDLDHDGYPDVAVTLHGTSGIALFRGTGTGLAYVKTIPTGFQPVGLGLGDANGDGWLDLATASVASGTATFAKNDGGTWQFTTTVVASGAEPAGVAFVDIQGDGSAELAVSSSLNQEVRLFSLSGSGLTLMTSLSVGSVVWAASLDSADLNGDGFGDLVAAAHAFGDPENGCIVWLSNGTSLDAGTFFDGGGNTPLYLELVDLDCDNDVDIALSNSNSDTVSILANSGTGVFGPPSSFAVEMSPMPISAGDVSGDGIPDLLVTNVNTESISVLTNLSCGLGPVGDFTGDGLVDAADLGILLGAWGTAGADLDGNGTTDAADLAALLGSWS